MVSRNGTNPAIAEHDLQDQLTDLWEIIYRHLALVLTCLAILMGLGALYYLKATRTYQSQSDLLIVNKHISNFGNQPEEARPVSQETLETHAIRLQSPLIVERAVKDHDLASLPSLVDQEDAVQYIIENMMVNRKDDNATVLNLRFRCPDAKDCRDVVLALTTTYENFLGESNQKLGRQTATLIKQANQMLALQIKENEDKYQEFQTKAPLMWRDGQGVNIHHERQSQIEVSRQALMVELTVLKAKIDALDASIATGGVSREAVKYEALMQLKPETEGIDWRAFKIAEQEQMAGREAVRQYSSLLMGEYVRLMVQRSELLDEYGEGHPELNSVTKRKTEVKRLLNGLLSQDMGSLTSLVLEEGNEEEKDYVTIYMQMLRDRLAILKKQIERLDAEFQAEQVLANRMQRFLLEDQAFRSERDRTKLLFDEVVARLKEINLVDDEYGGDSVSVLAKAEIGEQVAPRIVYVGVASMFLGCLLGSILAWIVDRSENTFRSAAEVRQALRVPVVGQIPHIRKRDQVASTSLPHIAPIVCTLHQDKSHLAEAFRAVRTSLYFSTSGQDHKVIQITSPLPGDGKSTVTANLAVAIAKSGKRVLVMDADFRRPAMLKLLGKPRNCTHGLAAVIAGKGDPVDSAIATDIPNLFFLPALERPLNPSELLSTPQFKNLLDMARERFDFVLIDTPPILAVTDPCAVAARVDGVLLTLRIRKGCQAVSVRAMEMLESVEANVLGTIVNGVDEKSGFRGVEGGYGKYGKYGVYSDRHGDSGRRRGNGIKLRQPSLR